MIVDGPLRVGGTLHAVWKPLAILATLHVVVTVAYMAFALHWLVPRDVPLPLLGTGLVVFVGLRNSAAYARWWEARTLWGSVVNQSRNFARTVVSLLPGTDQAGLREALVAHQIAWASALRRSLRREEMNGDTLDTLPATTRDRLATAGNAPFAVQRTMGEMLSDALENGQLDSMRFMTLNTILNALTDAQGGLERIRNTPMPHHYAVLPRLFVLLYGALLPFGIVTDLGWFTPVASLTIALVFLTLDRAGANLENPFARTVHDLPMTTICRTIEIDLKDTVDHPDQPSPIRAVRGVLR